MAAPLVPAVWWIAGGLTGTGGFNFPGTYWPMNEPSSANWPPLNSNYKKSSTHEELSKTQKKVCGNQFRSKNSKLNEQQHIRTGQTRVGSSSSVAAGLDWWWSVIVCKQTWSEVGGRFVIGVKLNFDCNFVLLFRRKRRVA